MKLSASIHCNRLAVRQRLAEGHPFLGVLGAELKTSLDHADATRAVAECARHLSQCCA